MSRYALSQKNAKSSKVDLPRALHSLFLSLLLLFSIHTGAAEKITTASLKLTENDIAQLIDTVGIVEQGFKLYPPPEPDEATQKKLRTAAFDGTLNRTMEQAVAGTELYREVDRAVKIFGFRNYEEYALQADAVWSIFVIDTFVKSSYLFGKKDQKIDNLWHYMHDEGLDEKDRQKLNQWMDDMLKKFNSNRHNAELVYNHLEELQTAFGYNK